MTGFGMVLTTVAVRDDGVRIAEALLAEKLAACVQMMPIESRYVWKGETHNEGELLLLVKTRASLFGAAIARIRALHPYEVPEIVACPFAAGLPAYLDWIADNTKSVP